MIQRCEDEGPYGLTCERQQGHKAPADLHSAAAKGLTHSIFWDDQGVEVEGRH